MDVRPSAGNSTPFLFHIISGCGKPSTSHVMLKSMRVRVWTVSPITIPMGFRVSESMDLLEDLMVGGMGSVDR